MLYLGMMVMSCDTACNDRGDVNGKTGREDNQGEMSQLCQDREPQEYRGWNVSLVRFMPPRIKLKICLSYQSECMYYVIRVVLCVIVLVLWIGSGCRMFFPPQMVDIHDGKFLFGHQGLQFRHVGDISEGMEEDPLVLVLIIRYIQIFEETTKTTHSTLPI